MQEKYDRIGQGYNLTRKADPYLVSRLLFHLEPDAQGRYLDIGCGTGNYTVKLHQGGYQFIGVEPSQEMLDKARATSTSIQWLQGKAEAIPLENKSINGTIASLTLHHWSSLETGFKEVCRVMKPGARLVIYTSTPEQMQGYWLNHYFPKMLEASIVQMPSYDLVESSLLKSSFQILSTEAYAIRADLEDLFLYAGKQRPELYLDPQVRKGISSFAALAHAEEVKLGLETLEKDIASGEIEKIMEKYVNDLGDYLFVIAQKSLSN